MSHRERLETAWSFREPDRVPIELCISPDVRQHPKAQGLVALIDEHADNFVGVPGADFGFLGFPTDYHETLIEECPGEYRRIQRVHETPAGTFTAVTYHPEGNPDYHWERRFISTLDDLHRIVEAPRKPVSWDKDAWHASVEEVGDSGLPIIFLLHPLGFLVRNAAMEQMYAWLHEERKLVHRFLAVANQQVAEAVDGMMSDGIGPCFCVVAHEMLLPPWMGHELFDEFVFPYDKAVNDTIHKHGGKLRIHCHGNCMEFLERFADMGVGAIEPLEHPPAGDVDLAEAKRRVGNRMMLSGNIASEHFVRMKPDEVREQVKRAIAVAAPGGGYTLRTSGGHAGTSPLMPDDEMAAVLMNCEAYLMAGLEYGQYPIGQH